MIIGITGGSGCGKTTLLNAIGGLDKVDQGTITIDGRPIKFYFSKGIWEGIANIVVDFLGMQMAEAFQ